MQDESATERCRLVLISPARADWREAADLVRTTFGAGDIAAMILRPAGLNEGEFQKLCQEIVPEGQEVGIAMVVAGDTRIAGRSGADGVHLESIEDLRHETGRRDGRIIGAGGATTRHDALEIGELMPDYLLFGRFDGDVRPEAHQGNLELGQWWAEMVEIPCIVLGGAAVESVVEVAATGAEFVALGAAVFEAPEGPAGAVARANALLDRAQPDRVKPGQV